MLLGKIFKIALISGRGWIWTQVCLTSQPEFLYDLVQFVYWGHGNVLSSMFLKSLVADQFQKTRCNFWFLPFTYSSSGSEALPCFISCRAWRFCQAGKHFIPSSSRLPDSWKLALNQESGTLINTAGQMVQLLSKGGRGWGLWLQSRRCLMIGICSEKFVMRWFCHRASITYVV